MLGKFNRRAFLQTAVAPGVSTAAAYSALSALDNNQALAESFVDMADMPQVASFDNPGSSTDAIGEEDSGITGYSGEEIFAEPDPIADWSEDPSISTEAMGEEDDGLGYEMPVDPGMVSTMAVGEEDSGATPPSFSMVSQPTPPTPPSVEEVGDAAVAVPDVEETALRVFSAVSRIAAPFSSPYSFSARNNAFVQLRWPQVARYKRTQLLFWRRSGSGTSNLGNDQHGSV